MQLNHMTHTAVIRACAEAYLLFSERMASTSMDGVTKDDDEAITTALNALQSVVDSNCYSLGDVSNNPIIRSHEFNSNIAYAKEAGYTLKAHPTVPGLFVFNDPHGNNSDTQYMPEDDVWRLVAEDFQSSIEETD